MSELTDNQVKIKSELETARQHIKTDGYSMSIGELINLYRDEELKLDPAFQRLFRWDDEQKTKLIESILIGIPVPEIFIAQKSDATWHVVDGVQRLSTILQLTGNLAGKEKLVMTSCKYIPSLKGKRWDDLPAETQRELKRTKLKINIILTQNSDEAQYELFQRLNTGGTSLSDQEVRNCLMLMINPDFFEKINTLKDYPNYKDCLKLERHQFEKEYHMELILRMFIGYFDKVNYESHSPISYVKVNEFIDKETINLMANADLDDFSNVFQRTFDLLKNSLGDKSFIKYYPEKGDFSGSFNVSIFEMLTVGISSNIEKMENIGVNNLKDRIKALYDEENIQNSLNRGVKAIVRFRDTTKASREFFGQ
ncbi:DUF262 domain-containing protein [Vibrio parahaemolyticus]|uniref:DUF262 domain-containing protein n=1 Tax=Vibrio parahaemolyticus TaxID=670 RepID=UPI00038E2B40|nr:DUF262 domain-containing protein [Vibrio parahaemolyticus]EGQ9164990.1 DUF262 domain-containing protein [Vibrio parahaemolyticus]EJG1788395.1 DUF262 domain-containing protein [Vibrio parahaemolyticus]EJG1921060.1 DUF262 domain-containing protein [Vibrio parahaemolyticus]EJG1947040.1 DUF262 domain-containing protein [Vibrio parahaemolyticus]EQL96152.1 hypothetical protein D035_2592 [Vibrio parahaemolyticus VP250]